MGGAMIPVSVGRLGDHFGLRAGFTFLYLIFGCVLSVGLLGQADHYKRHRSP
jgi:FHS family L-fucose permease-like MFS transporter